MNMESPVRYEIKVHRLKRKREFPQYLYLDTVDGEAKFLEQESRDGFARSNQNLRLGKS